MPKWVDDLNKAVQEAEAYNPVKNALNAGVDKLQQNVNMITPDMGAGWQALKSLGQIGTNFAGGLVNMPDVFAHPIEAGKQIIDMGKQYQKDYLNKESLDNIKKDPSKFIGDTYNMAGMLEGARQGVKALNTPRTSVTKVNPPVETYKPKTINKSMGGDGIEVKVDTRPVLKKNLDNQYKEITPEEYFNIPDNVSVQDYFLRYSPEAIQNSSPKAGLPSYYVSQATGIPESSLRSHGAASINKNVNDIYTYESAVGAYYPMTDSIALANFKLNPNSVIGTTAHELAHQQLKLLQDEASKGNIKAQQFLYELHSSANMPQPVARNEVVSRAFQSLADPAYQVPDSALQYLGGNRQIYNDIRNYLQKYNNEYLFSDLLRKTR